MTTALVLLIVSVFLFFFFILIKIPLLNALSEVGEIEERKNLFIINKKFSCIKDFKNKISLRSTLQNILKSIQKLNWKIENILNQWLKKLKK